MSHLLVVHHFLQGVQQRPQVGIDFRLQVAGQKAKTLARLHRRPHQHDLANGVIFESLDRHCHREVGFSRARRPHREDEVMVADCVHIAGLPWRARPNLATGKKHLGGLMLLDAFVAGHQGQDFRYVVGFELTASLHEQLELLQDLGRMGDLALAAGHANLVISMAYRDPERLANLVQVLVARAEKRESAR